MAEEHHHVTTTPITPDEPKIESSDRGLFDFIGKKEEQKKPQEEALAADLEKVHVSEPEKKVGEEHKEEEKKHTLRDKLHRSDSSSSSSSDEEEKEGEEKKKKKKEKKKEEVVDVPIEGAAEPDEKKGIFGKIKDKLPGGTAKKTEDAPSPAPHPAPHAAPTEEEPKKTEEEPKKGILEKIKEKLPGYHSKTEEEKEKEKD